MTADQFPHLVVVGAGTIGSYLGGRLTEGARVTLIGRAPLMDAINRHGLVLGDSSHEEWRVPADGERLVASVDHRLVADADVVLITVKTYDNVAIAETIKRQLRPGTPVVSIQNGVRNHAQIAQVLGPEFPVIPGVIGYNVVHTPPTTFHQTTGGVFQVGNHPDLAPLYQAARDARLGLEGRDDISASQHAKLLFNLNNAINALSGLPLRAQLADPQFRQVLAHCQSEALECFEAAGIEATPLHSVPAGWMVKALRSPTWLFTAVAQAKLGISREARMSMSDDLARGRRTEISEFQGYVCELGQRHDVPTPVCAALVRLIEDASTRVANGERLPRWTGAALLRAVTDR